MPRKPEPSFKLKAIVWGIAAKVGKGKLAAIQRQLEYDLEELREKESFFEDTPDVRTIKRIIEVDINELPQDVVAAELPPHVWHLRNDYESVKGLREQSSERREGIAPLVTKAREEHFGQIRNLLERWCATLDSELSGLLVPVAVHAKEEDERLFPYALQHCPSIDNEYQVLKTPKKEYEENLKRLREEVEESLFEALAKGEIADQLVPVSRYKFIDNIAQSLVYPGNPFDIARLGISLPEDKGIAPWWYPLTRWFAKGNEETLESCREFFDRLLKKYPEKISITETMKRYEKFCCDAYNVVLHAVEDSLLRHEYVHHKCDWCP